MLLRKEYADKYAVINKWENAYEGPIILTKKDSRGNYKGIYDETYDETEQETRWAPPSHWKPFARLNIILDKKKNPNEGFDYIYLIEFDDKDRYWLDEYDTPVELIREFKERSLLKKVKQATRGKLERRKKQIEEAIERYKNELKTVDEELKE